MRLCDPTHENTSGEQLNARTGLRERYSRHGSENGGGDVMSTEI